MTMASSLVRRSERIRIDWEAACSERRMSHNEAVEEGKAINAGPNKVARTYYAAFCPQLENFTFKQIEYALFNLKPSFRNYVHVSTSSESNPIATIPNVNATKFTVRSTQCWTVKKEEDNLIDLFTFSDPCTRPGGNTKAQANAKKDHPSLPAAFPDFLSGEDNSPDVATRNEDDMSLDTNTLGSDMSYSFTSKNYVTSATAAKHPACLKGSTTNSTMARLKGPTSTGAGVRQQQQLQRKGFLGGSSNRNSSMSGGDIIGRPGATNTPRSVLTPRPNKRSRMEFANEPIHQPPSRVERLSKESLSALLTNEVGCDIRFVEFNDKTDISRTLTLFGQSEACINNLLEVAASDIAILHEAQQKLSEQRRDFDKGRMQYSAGHCGNTLGLASLSLGGGSTKPPTHVVSFSNKTNDDVSVLSGGTINESQGKESSLKSEKRLDTVEEAVETTDAETKVASDESNKVATGEDTKCARSQSKVVEVEDASASQI